MSYKIVVSKPGYNALTDNNPDHLIFSSDFNTLKYYASGSYILHVVASAYSYYNVVGQINHNLGYRPFFKVYSDFIDYNTFSPVGIFYLPDTEHSKFVGAAVDTTKIYFYCSGYTLKNLDFYVYFYYKLFKNNINL